MERLKTTWAKWEESNVEEEFNVICVDNEMYFPTLFDESTIDVVLIAGL